MRVRDGDGMSDVRDGRTGRRLALSWNRDSAGRSARGTGGGGVPVAGLTLEAAHDG